MRDPPLSSTTSNTRLPHLDAVRGIAAFVVVVHHALLAVPSGRGLIELIDRIPGLRVIALGRPAVILFFVLSGFVLTRCIQAKPSGFALFAVRRLARLMPAYWFAIGLSVGAFWLVPRHTASDMSAWFNSQWGGGVSVTGLLRHLAMLSCAGQYPLDHVAWSLVHELRLSILLPVFVSCCRRDWHLPCLVASGFMAIGAEFYASMHPSDFPPGLHGFLFDAPRLGDSFVLTARFGFAFMIGSALATRWDWIDSVLSRHRRLFAPVLIVAFGLLSSTMELAMAVGAILLLAAVTSSKRVASQLTIAPLEWLGRVSYSLYLIHMPIMLSCGLALDGIVPAWAKITIAVLISLPASELLYRSIEAPSILWSRQLGTRSAKTADLAAAPALAVA